MGVEHFAKLELLNCNNNQLTALDVTKNPELVKLYCDSNQLKALNVTNNPALDLLCCNMNQLTVLDVTKNLELNVLGCRDNQLIALDVTKNPKLEGLTCGTNQLTALDVTKNLELKNLNCYENQLTALDVTNNLKLDGLDCDSNQLTSLDLTANTKIFNFSGIDQKYNVKVSKSDLTFDLSSLPGTFDPLKASEWKGGTVSGNTLTLSNADTKEVTYKYEAQSDKFIGVTLKVKYKEEPLIISFYPGDGWGSMADVYKNAGETYVLPECGFTAPAGKAFKAWEVGGVEKAVGDSITVNANTIVKALWKDKKGKTDIGKAKVSGIKTKTYTGKNIKQNPIIKIDSKTLKSGTDYSLTYNKNKYIGKAKVTIKGKGKYEGIVIKYFKIVPRKVSIKKPTAGVKKVKVRWYKVPGNVKYQVAYKKKGSSKYKMTYTSSTYKTIKKLKSKKYYYVKVRAYKRVNGSTYYGAWSATKRIKIK